MRAARLVECPTGYIVRMQVVFADGAHHHFAGIDADPHLQGGARATQSSLYRRISSCMRSAAIERSLEMIFMGNRRAEQRKDTIP